jgi:alpha-L-fucosidase
MKKFLLTFASFLIVFNLFPQQKRLSKEERLEWFKNAKLGIFMHWGVYSVDGTVESWPLKNKQMSWNDYMAQAKGFTAANYHPEEWAKLFKKAGARYVVLTTKHHDGFALWPTRYSKLNCVDYSPAKRDLIGPYTNAMRDAGLKVGFYFSLLDWSHKDYPVNFPRPEKKIAALYPQPGWQKHLTKHDRFILFMDGQLSELSHNYHPDLLWFDGDWEHNAEWWRAGALKDSLLKWNPSIVVNGRLQGHGDYGTPEQGIPVTRPKGIWELCMTTNDSWGYRPSDTNYKPMDQIIRTFVEVISEGGNLLLDIGPKADGTLDERQVKILEELGAWIDRNKEAVYDTKAGLLPGHFYGPTLISKDDMTLYLAVYGEPKGYIGLKGLKSKIKKIRVVGSGEKLKWVRNGGAKWMGIPGIVRIDVPKKESLDPYVTMIAVELKEPVKVYHGTGVKED